MRARFRKFIYDFRSQFWVIPALMVLAGMMLAALGIFIDRLGVVPDALENGTFLYSGGASGARGLLGAVASSTIAVAGTVFSITIAALSLAAGQMGPRLMRNFTRDTGNQFVLGIFLGTFVYSLLVLRSVRPPDEGQFVPSLSVTLGLALAIICVAALVWFVDHMAGRINVDVVVKLVSDDLRETIERLTEESSADVPPPPLVDWGQAQVVLGDRAGYLHNIDAEGLATWARQQRVSVRLLKRPGDFVFPHAPFALVTPTSEDAVGAIRNAMAVGAQRDTSHDLEHSVRQLVEVALRALSPGINDPHTAISVLDQLGAGLCLLVPRHLVEGRVAIDGQVTLILPSIDYDGLVDAMFLEIRQAATSQPSVLIRMLEVLAEVALAERDPLRRRSLARHADLVLGDAERTIANANDLAAIRERHRSVTRPGETALARS